MVTDSLLSILYVMPQKLSIKNKTLISTTIVSPTKKKSPETATQANPRDFFKYKTLIRKNGHTLKVNVLKCTHYLDTIASVT